MTATTDDTTHGAHGSHAVAGAVKQEEHQQHPLKVYFAVWILLFVLSAFSYMVDYFDLHGYLRWTLIILFMMLKAGFIVAIFMHMAWERLALVLAILMPPLAVLVFTAIMAFEGDYTFFTRLYYFVAGH